MKLSIKANPNNLGKHHADIQDPLNALRRIEAVAVQDVVDLVAGDVRLDGGRRDCATYVNESLEDSSKSIHKRAS